ncbi:GumC family protein [Caulobacter hibisci]|uniref:non-specific protein-tyrosine kinase n=1 Tax=Caulobacter hibisci TaxID=2035993 RepID=A0ABS0T553_9CAUL|nr:polysaccharide biosynthesis tyrosine autokinase [Caulobacter hibisci]MBI1687003.1 polysaccharide biosynthesis tyrosine autokinase [Caulobacter hibisci]
MNYRTFDESQSGKLMYSPGNATASRPVASASTNLIDLRRIFGTIRRRQWWALATGAIVLALTLVAYLQAKPVYTATARVGIDRRVEDLVTPTQGAAAPLATDSSSVDTEVQVLTSPRVAGAVVDRLGLAARPGFGGSHKDRDQAIERVRSGLAVKREGNSYAIRVSYSNGDAALATKIVNATIDEYVSGQRGDKVNERSRETALLSDRLAKLKSDVLQAEAAVARYRGATNLIDIQKDGTAVQQEISLLNGQLATAKADNAAAASRVTASRGADGLESAVLRALRGQQAELSAQRANLASKYFDTHPSIQKIDRQIADVNASINNELRSIRAGYNADLRVSEGRVASIQSSLDRARGALNQANSASVELAELERNAESARGLYQSLLDRYLQSVTGQGTERSNAYVISSATQPSSPDSPDLKLYLLSGVIAGTLAAAGVILLLELLESGFQTRADVESKLGVPVMTSVPDLAALPGTRVSRRDPMAPANYLVSHDGSVFSESFRSIRAALSLGRADSKIRSLAVCSALPAEGKTTVSICLARSAAMAGLRTLLVDCDLRRRSSSASLSSNVKAGLIEVLKGEVQLRDAVIKDEASGAWLLPQRASETHDYDIITSKAMETLVESLRGSFDLIILDTAPVLALADARAVAAMADGVLFTVRWRKTPTNAAHMALEQLDRAGARVVGATLTQVNLQQQARAGAGDEMIYYNKFKSYYAT